jgi:hypothetical protein
MVGKSNRSKPVWTSMGLPITNCTSSFTFCRSHSSRCSGFTDDLSISAESWRLTRISLSRAVTSLVLVYVQYTKHFRSWEISPRMILIYKVKVLPPYLIPPPTWFRYSGNSAEYVLRERFPPPIEYDPPPIYPPACICTQDHGQGLSDFRS